MGLMELADGKLKIKKDFEVTDKSHIIEEMEAKIKSLGKSKW